MILFYLFFIYFAIGIYVLYLCFVFFFNLHWVAVVDENWESVFEDELHLSFYGWQILIFELATVMCVSIIDFNLVLTVAIYSVIVFDFFFLLLEKAYNVSWLEWETQLSKVFFRERFLILFFWSRMQIQILYDFYWGLFLNFYCLLFAGLIVLFNSKRFSSVWYSLFYLNLNVIILNLQKPLLWQNNYSSNNSPNLCVIIQNMLLFKLNLFVNLKSSWMFLKRAL